MHGTPLARCVDLQVAAAADLDNESVARADLTPPLPASIRVFCAKGPARVSVRRR